MDPNDGGFTAKGLSGGCLTISRYFPIVSPFFLSITPCTTLCTEPTFFDALSESDERYYETKRTTLSNGYLGSRNDEERSEMRYVMRIAEFSESSNL